MPNRNSNNIIMYHANGEPFYEVKNCYIDPWFPLSPVGNRADWWGVYPPYTNTTNTVPTYEFKVVDKHYEFELELAGAKRELLVVELQDNRVVKLSYDNKNDKYRKLVNISVTLPGDAKPETLKTSYVDGVFKVKCEKTEKVVRKLELE